MKSKQVLRCNSLRLPSTSLRASRSGQAGQAYVETIFITPIFVMFLVMMTFFARVYITKIILEQAARHGVFLIVYSNYNAAQVKHEIIDYLTNEKHLLKNIKEEDIQVTITHGFSPSKVTIRYRLPIPVPLSKLRGSTKPFFVTGHSRCYNDTWAARSFLRRLKKMIKGKK